MINCYRYHRELEQSKQFTMTEQHLALLRHAYVRWSEVEFGAPEIDGKRPYGNSDVIHDIAEILGESFPDDDAAYERWMEENADRLTRLHVETAIALKIILCVGKSQAGAYVRGSHGEWRLDPET